MKSNFFLFSILYLLCLSSIVPVLGQSGRRALERENLILNVITEGGKSTAELTKDKLTLFDGGIQQEIQSFMPDPTASRIVILVDNSVNLAAEVEKLEKAASAFLGELYEGDEVMVIGYDENAEIIEDFTGDLAKLQAAMKKFRKRGLPRFYDALQATVEEAMRKEIGIDKRIIILISDGYDRKSTTKFETALATLQSENVVVYALQIKDRTFGAPNRTGPKPPDALAKLAEGTGGRVYKIEEAERAAKEISHELRSNWYKLTYKPTGVNPINARRLLITCVEDKVVLRTKALQPGKVR